MARPVTLFTGQWADVPIAKLAAKAKKWGYDGLELACWGDHFEVRRALKEPDYCKKHRAMLKRHGMEVYAISNHLAGQLVCDPNDSRSRAFAPKRTHKDPEKMRTWGVNEMKRTAKAAAAFGVKTVNGFTGSSIWHKLYFFPPPDPEEIDAGYDYFAEKWDPILDVFEKEGVRFALEVHPTEIAYDIYTAARALEAIDYRPEFGFNFDPSHLHWQEVSPVAFLEEFSDRIYHTHMKDAVVTLDGISSILSSHLNFGDERRGWDFRSPGRGSVNFEEIIRALNRIGYQGPLSVEWEDSGMDREHGAAEACEFVRSMDFPVSGRSFDAAFEKD